MSDRLQELLDRQDINDALLRYCRGVDRCDAELINSAYHPDAVDHHGAITASGTEIGVILATKLRAQYRATMHRITNSLVELNGDEAAVETYYDAQHIYDEDGHDVLLEGVGRYIDRFKRRDGQWRIVRRTVVTDWARSIPVEGPRPPFSSPPSERTRHDLSYANFHDVRRGAPA